MSQENVELVQSVFARWNAGDHTAPDEELHPDVELVSQIMGGSVRGRAGVRRWLREIDQQFDEWTLIGEEWHDAGECVVALGRIRLHGRSSGVAFDQPMGWLFEFRDGQLTRLETFAEDPGAALEAAGLSE